MKHTTASGRKKPSPRCSSTLNRSPMLISQKIRSNHFEFHSKSVLVAATGATVVDARVQNRNAVAHHARPAHPHIAQTAGLVRRRWRRALVATTGATLVDARVQKRNTVAIHARPRTPQYAQTAGLVGSASHPCQS